MDIDSIITDYITTHWKQLAVVGSILLALKICRPPKMKGWFGEKVVERWLKKLNPEQYHIFHDLYLPRPDGKGTTQIDHLVVSRFGLFVIETKNYKGWIFGGEKQRQWTQRIYKVKHKFQNPLHQNALHINALVQLLGLEKSAFHNLIFFIGECTFKTDLPPNVMTRGLLPFIQKHRDPLLSEEEVLGCVSAIEQLTNGTDKRHVAKQHVQSLRQRQTPKAKLPINTSGPSEVPILPEIQSPSQEPLSVATPPSCPKCTQPMVERIAKKGTHAGSSFWGCGQFPKCRGTSR